jgi:glycosyltransferase involved in cell wall biosynthesis
MKPRLLMVAYACDPKGGGEHWLGWGWAEQAAKSFDVELVTTPKAKASIVAAAEPLGIKPHFIDVPPSIRKVTELFGGSWLRKIAWQKQVGKFAARRHREQRFAAVHQTTFHTFRSPFAAAALPVPSIWGPIAGGEYVPPGFEIYLGSAKSSERARSLANRAWLRVPSVEGSLRNASALFVSNRTTLGFLPESVRAKARVVPPNALRPEDERWQPRELVRQAGARLKLLYVGNCLATRALPIVFEALEASGLKNFQLKIVGAGPAIPHWRKLVKDHDFGANVVFAGRVPFEQINAFYGEADALVFPALRDSGGSAVLEAMARYVPVICLDWAGPGEMLDAESGLKIPVRTPAETVSAFAEALVHLESQPELGLSLAAAARRRAQDHFSWEAKRVLLEQTFERLRANL